MRRSSLLMVLLLAAAGCATVRPRAHHLELLPPRGAEAGFQEQAARVRAAFEARRELALDAAEAEQVLLLVESYPRGTVRVRGELRVQPDADYELLLGYDLYATGATTLWFADYASGWRKAYCYPQVPLTWATLGLWQLVVPLSWPCAARARMSRPLAWDQVRHLARAAGADAAIVELKTAGDEVVVAWGWLLRRKR